MSRLRGFFIFSCLEQARGRS